MVKGQARLSLAVRQFKASLPGASISGLPEIDIKYAQVGRARLVCATKQSPPFMHAQVKRDCFASLAMTRWISLRLDARLLDDALVLPALALDERGELIDRHRDD